MTGVRHGALRLSLGTLLGAALACAGAPAPGAGAPPTDDGIYDFTASTGEPSPLRGSLTIVAGTHSLSPEFGSCRVDQAFASSERTRYLCDNTSDVERLAFVIDRRFPLTRSQWNGTIRQRRTRTVCVSYATQNGRQVCVEQRTEEYVVNAPVSGRLTFRRRPAQDEHDATGGLGALSAGREVQLTQ